MCLKQDSVDKSIIFYYAFLILKLLLNLKNFKIMDKRMIKGPSVSLIKDFISSINNHIKSKTFYLPKPEVEKKLKENDYYFRKTGCTYPSKTVHKLFVMHPDVFVKLLLLSEIFPYLFRTFRLKPEGEHGEIIVADFRVLPLIEETKSILDMINGAIK